MRKACVSGLFYPADGFQLKRMLEGLFSGIKQNGCLAVICPHAGYVYSGKTAAFAIGSLEKQKTWVILGPNHHGLGHSFALSLEEWETPLGRVAIDRELAKKLQLDFLTEDKLAHLQEHSIEVILPFLQYRFSGFRFLPISILNVDYSEELLEKCIKLGEFLTRFEVGLIASSDFSHYLPAEEAEEADKMAVKAILELDPKKFFRVLEENQISVCGYGPIACLLAWARKLGLKAEVLHHSNSGEVTGDFGSVVTYWAIGFKKA